MAGALQRTLETVTKIEPNPFGETRRRLIAFGTLSWPLRMLTMMTIAELVACGVLLSIGALPLPHLTISVSPAGQFVWVPTPVYLLVLLALTLGWCCVVVAALYLPVLPRLMISVLGTAILGISSVTGLATAFAQSRTAVLSPWTWLVPSVQLAALGTLLGWVIACSILPLWQPQSAARPHRSRSTTIVAGLIWLYYFVDLLAVLVWDPVAPAVQFIPSGLAMQSTLLPSLLAFVVYWGSTDFIEWGETLAAYTAHLVRASAPVWVFIVLTALTASAVVWDVFRRLGIMPLLPSLATAVVLLALITLLTWAARGGSTWPAGVPLDGLVGGAVFLYLFVQATSWVVELLTQLAHLPDAAINPLYTVLSVSLAVALLAAGLVLVIRGRHDRRTERVATGLLLSIVAVLVVGLSTPQLANVFHLPVIRELQPNVHDFKVIVGVTMVGTIILLMLRRQLSSRVVEPLIAGLMLLVGLQVIGWYFQLLLPGLHALSNTSVVIAATLFVAAIMWDMVTSGEQVTNRHSEAFPRAARVLLYLGYALLASATFLYATMQHIATTGQAVPVTSVGLPLEVVGAEGLGLPLLALSFIQRMGRWRSRQGTGGGGQDGTTAV